MTEYSWSDHELIRRYLAGKLDDAEALMVETRIVQDPAFRREVELSAAMKEGFRELERRGEVRALLAGARSRGSRVRIAAIAATALVASVIAVFVYRSEPRQPAPSGAPETLRFELKRGESGLPDVVWVRSNGTVPVPMSLDVGLAPAATYALTIYRVEDHSSTPILRNTLPVSENGELQFEVERSLLERGNYRIEARPVPPAAPDQTVAYSLTVR
jgi:hypothetical protein